MRYLFLSAIVISLVGLVIPNAFAENVPDWVKNTAGWWATNLISETEFMNAIEYLVKENIIHVNASQTSETSQNVPDWVKNTAGWWATNLISETEFVNAIAYLIENGIINIESSKSPEISAKMWINGYITDYEFLASIEDEIEDSNKTESSQLPDWLVNNAGWWSARILTNSDYTANTSYIYEVSDRCNECIETINNHGFRGEDFSKEKSDNVFRIFAVGGSTTFGTGVNDHETWPSHLQQKFDQVELGVEVEVINSGIGNSNTRTEISLIKDKILFLNPDLIIMYDGWNDIEIPINETFENWKSVCEFGNENGFETLITVQPIAGTGNRVLTEQELLNFYTHRDNGKLTNNSVDEAKKILYYTEELDKLNKYCYKTVDFTSIFDYISEPIYFDTGHTGPLGNKIIAENLYPLVTPLILENSGERIYFDTETNHPLTISDSISNSGVFAARANLSEKNFMNLDLSNSVFFKANLQNANFDNANLDNVDFRSSDLTGASFNNANLNNAIFSFAKLDGIDLSQQPFLNIELSKTDLRNADISNLNLSSKDLSHANLSNQNIKNFNLSNTNLMGTDLSYAILPNDLSGHDFRSTKFYGTDLTGRNFSESNISYSIFDNADLTKVNFRETVALDSDFSKTKSLADADLTLSSFAYSNLSGVNLSGAILDDTNFWKSNLSGVDFTTVYDASIDTTTFMETNLTNSNFENVNLSPNEQYFKVFKNKAYLIRDIAQPSENESIAKKDLFGEFSHASIISAEVRGNDLAVKYIFVNSFKGANLENANFKNASLWHADFHLADLTNADLSGADLRNAFLGQADLSNTNLENANLSGVHIDNNTILKCKNHPICLNE